MIIFNPDRMQKVKMVSEANQEAMMSICTIHIDKIFALLHVKAFNAAKAKVENVIVENTAADGNDDKNAVFHSAGEHMICAKSATEGGKVNVEDAFNAIQEYVNVFLGPDIGKKLKEEDLLPLDGDPDGGSAEGTDVSESRKLSFKRYLNEHFIFTESDEDDDGEDADEDDDGEDADEDDDGEDAEEDDEGEDADEDDEGEDGNNGDEGEGADEGDDSKDGEDEGKDPKDKEYAGLYILYGLKIKGMKETTAEEALKQWGSNFLKGFGVQLGSMWSGKSGEVHTIGGFMDKMGQLFGSIRMPEDTDELAQNVQSALSKKFPSLPNITASFRDQRTIIKELDKIPRTGYDGKVKQKIKSAEYSMYIDVQGDDVRQPLLNRKEIANVVTMNIRGIVKKFKHGISADDVIYLKGTSLESSHDDREDAFSAVPTPDFINDLLDEIPDKRPDNPGEFTLTKPEMPGDSALSADMAKYKQDKKDYDDIKRNYEADVKQFKDWEKNIKKAIDKIKTAFDKSAKKKKIKNPDIVKTLVDEWTKVSKGIIMADEPEVKLAKGKKFAAAYEEKYKELLNKHRQDSDDAPDDMDESIISGIIGTLFESIDIDEIHDILEADDPEDEDDDTGEEDEDEEDEDEDEDDNTSGEDAGEGEGNGEGEAAAPDSDGSQTPANSEEPEQEPKAKDDNDVADHSVAKGTGNDLYIIPMPGIKAKKNGDDDWKDK